MNHEFWYYTMCSVKGYIYICLILSFKNKRSAIPYIHMGVIVDVDTVLRTAAHTVWHMSSEILDDF